MNWQDQPRSERVIVALDLDEHGALGVADELQGAVRWLKVGLTLYVSAGPQVVGALRARGFEVFLDLKLHDIPHQVEGAARAVSSLDARMLTVHASGGQRMIRAAVDGAGAGDVAVLGVTMLTSLDYQDLDELGIGEPAKQYVARLARVASHGGAHGVVCSPREASEMRLLLGPDALVVTPGIRLDRTSSDDQARTAGPREAFDDGASHIVVGRPVTASSSPVEAIRRLSDGLEA
jgi:orotidine-5'-phosphate decarboxylase